MRNETKTQGSEMAAITLETGMTKTQAKEMAEKFRETGEFTSVRESRIGGDFPLPSDGYRIELWSGNGRTSNRHLTQVEEYDPKMVPAITRQAKGKATESKLTASRLSAAQREMDAS